MRVGVYAFGGCEGCRYRLVEKLLELAGELGIEIAYEPLVGREEEAEEYDVVFVEGAVASEEDREKLMEIRRKARVLVAMGSCAVLGGIPGLRRVADDEAVEGVYGGLRLPKKPVPAAPLSRYVEVDYWLRGCPPSAEEFETLLRSLAAGLWYRQGERRIDYCREEVISIKGTALHLSGHKCIVCGRCVAVCKSLGISALGYAYRSIETTITTPFAVDFDESTCVSCGLCTYYCPVGALTEREKLSEVQRLLREGERLDVYIEPESVAAIASRLGCSELQVVTALKELGFERVILWTPPVGVGIEDAVVAPASQAEYLFVKKFYPELLRKTAPPPSLASGVLISPCVARKLSTEAHVLTTREALRMLGPIDPRGLDPAEFDARVIQLPEEGVVKAVGPDEVRAALERVMSGELHDVVVALYLCPGGCAAGGGQPFPRSDSESLEKKTREIVARILNREK